MLQISTAANTPKNDGPSTTTAQSSASGRKPEADKGGEASGTGSRNKARTANKGNSPAAGGPEPTSAVFTSEEDDMINAMRGEGKDWEEIAGAIGKDKQKVVKRFHELKAKGKGKETFVVDAEEGSDTDPLVEGNKASARDVAGITYGGLDVGEDILNSNEASKQA